jgi:hypothetical protein
MIFTVVHSEASCHTIYTTVKEGEDIIIKSHNATVVYNDNGMSVSVDKKKPLIIPDYVLFDLPEIISILGKVHGNLLGQSLIFEGKPTII